MKYRKKPVVIEALVWSGSNWHSMLEFAGKENVYTKGADLFIVTLEGDTTVHQLPMKANPGDFIIQGVQGEFYPCKPDIFEATYEPVED